MACASGRKAPCCRWKAGCPQYISGLMLALPLLEGESRLRVEPPVESGPYIAMTEDALRLAGLSYEKKETDYAFPGRERPCLSGPHTVEGDWSNAAFFLCMGALSEKGVLVRGLDLRSLQGDRAVLTLLRDFGAEVREEKDGVLVRRGSLRGLEIDAAPIPDLIPVLSVLAAGAEGDTRIRNAARLRLKESDRLKTTAALLRGLGGSVEELADGLVIHGRGSLTGGAAARAGDHRTAMAAAGAAHLFGGTVMQCEYAAEIGLEHFLGLTCDPVMGLVQIPCIERNALAANRAVTAAELALLSDGFHRVSFDAVVRTMLQTGHDLPSLYRETAEGGLAAACLNSPARPGIQP